MSYNQPGPYGAPQQPQQPGPYGPGGAAGQPGYGYPQQPPASPYGQPPQPDPYGQQPPAPPYGAPQQGGWGQPQPGPYGQQPQPGTPGQYPQPVPPQGGGKGKAIGITIGALVVVGAIVGGVLFFKSGGGGSGGKVAPYTIVLPDSLLDGKYNKQQNVPDITPKLTEGDKAKALGITNGTEVAAAYKNAEQQGLSVRGVYGEVADPQKAVDAVFAQMDENSKKLGPGTNIETIAPVTEFHPSGFDGAVMKCRTVKVNVTMGSISSTAEGSTCVWGDSSAIGLVTHSVTKTSGGITGGATTTATGNAMSAKDLSEATAKVRTEVRKGK
ncbi:hypothetical protein [Streptomyces blastmyceticus]|uniref:Uncharacterized protein n=1 Tax=Streptomyces blastmyceticus TaxID=68180 RepID=A0ABP3FXC0_9ACTN